MLVVGAMRRVRRGRKISYAASA